MIELFRAGELKDVRGAGIFLATNKSVAKQYETTGKGGKKVETYLLDDNIRLFDTSDRWELIRELDKNWNFDKVYNRLISEQMRNRGLVNGLTAEQRLQNIVEKKKKNNE